MPNPVQPHETLRIEARYGGTQATLLLQGEFDLGGARVFLAHVSEAIKSRSEAIIIDGRALQFIDSSGLQALIRAREVTADAGMRLQIRDPSPPLRRKVEITGTEYLLITA
jgi:anti-anti-sigma factor